MKTAELSGAALDWAVSQAEGNGGVWYESDKDAVPFTPSTNWAQGGLIIEREKIDILYQEEFCWLAVGLSMTEAQGQTPLVAAMRCYVASKLGGEIEVLADLLEAV
jgi:hypothetical protein